MKNIRLILALAVLGLAASAIQAADAPPAAPESKPAKCCAKASEKGEKCGHGCCVEAAKAGNNCATCNGSGKIEKKPEEKK
jgi:hypothetical protein